MQNAVRVPQKGLPEWLKWVLLPMSIVLVVVMAILIILLVLAGLFALIIRKYAWASAIADLIERICDDS